LFSIERNKKIRQFFQCFWHHIRKIIRRNNRKEIWKYELRLFFKEPIEKKVLKRPEYKLCLFYWFYSKTLICDSRHRITDKGVKHIAKGLSSPYNKLKILSLSIYDGQAITDQGVKALIHRISRYLVDLKKLSILLGPAMGLGRAGLTDYTVEILKENLGKLSRNLEDLSIDLFGHRGIGKDCLFSLSDDLSFLSHLKINKKKMR